MQTPIEPDRERGDYGYGQKERARLHGSGCPIELTLPKMPRRQESLGPKDWLQWPFSKPGGEKAEGREFSRPFASASLPLSASGGWRVLGRANVVCRAQQASPLRPVANLQAERPIARQRRRVRRNCGS